MNNQRVQFAWARGARIQVQLKTGDEKWVSAINDNGRYLYVNPNYSLRAHPDDAHLEYGPLSSDLRRRAIEGDFEGMDVHWFDGAFRVPLWEGIWASFNYGDEIRWALSDLSRMHFLFLAEYLADEGL